MDSMRPQNKAPTILEALPETLSNITIGQLILKNDILENKLQNKPFFSPILNTGDLYIFSASRIHKLKNLIENNNRIVLATFGCVENGKIILYQ